MMFPKIQRLLKGKLSHCGCIRRDVVCEQNMKLGVCLAVWADQSEHSLPLLTRTLASWSPSLFTAGSLITKPTTTDLQWNNYRVMLTNKVT